jgi:hypothetical protein
MYTSPYRSYQTEKKQDDIWDFYWGRISLLEISIQQLNFMFHMSQLLSRNGIWAQEHFFIFSQAIQEGGTKLFNSSCSPKDSPGEQENTASA